VETQTAVLPVPAKIPRIAVYLDESVRQDLTDLANVERRSMSQMAAILIEKALEQAKKDGKINGSDENEQGTIDP
jgi:hypothetical protein